LTFLAHSGNRGGREEALRDHLQRVAEGAAAYANAFGAAEEARLAGLLHDLGKYSERFLDRLKGKAQGLDHWSIGAFVALKNYGWSAAGAALAILGHHQGLEQGTCRELGIKLGRLLRSEADRPTLTDPDWGKLLTRFRGDGLALPPEPRQWVFDAKGPKAGSMLDVRMLFSALVDADFYWTEAHFAGDGSEPYRPRKLGQYLDRETAAKALGVLQRYCEDIRARSTDAPHINRLRDDLLRACLAGGEWPQGAYTLSAPTGAGKTLAMLAFALRHAAAHGLRRIVVVIPYLSIIEQTARIYRELLQPVFGPDFVIEDHSMARLGGAGGGGGGGAGGATPVRDNEDEAARQAHLLAENWDAPLIVTTSVQCLESLFANRPGPCRKLHRLARSVILFDEVQTLPRTLAVPTLATLSRLTDPRYGSTVVFCTATQPAFDHLDREGGITKLCASGWKPREIAGSVDLFAAVRARPRQRVDWRLEQPVAWEQLVEELSRPEHAQALCIVNLKKHARLLAERLVARGAEGVLHLSTNMCPAHRTAVLEGVKRRIQPGSGAPCRLISTQCVEAGVDVDFPVVYRALGPLDAIAQAAGRCNRGGRREQAGRVVVFVPEEEGYPPGEYEQAAESTRTFLNMLRAGGRDGELAELLDSPPLLQRYYETLYALSDGMQKKPAKELHEAIVGLNFAEVAKLYRLIKDDTINVLVPYDPVAYEELCAQLKLDESDGRLTRQWVREAQPHAVGLRQPKPGDEGWNCLHPLRWSARQEPDDHTAEWFVLLEDSPGSLYDRDLLGLKELTASWIA
jgi:CRISPR-associated endonuclease Cas3-HD